MQHTTAAQAHFGDRRHRQLRWRSFIKRQQAYSAICKEISGGSRDTVQLWPMGMQSSAAAAARETLAHPQCHYGASLGTAAEMMNSEQASFAVPAGQPWMAYACVSLFQVTPTSADLIGFIICIVLCACIQYKAVQCSIMCMHMSGKLHKASQYEGSSALRIYD